MAGIYVPWLADAARLTGYPVSEVSGWRTRGHGGFRAIEGVVGHHTADGPGEYPSLNIVTRGRADLAGPLCNYGLARSGAVYVVAAGVAWHAGASRWAGFTDLNDEFLGIEAESAGTRDDWTPAQRDSYPRLVAAALYYMRRNAARFGGHKEVCLPPGRKIDPAFIDLPAFRSRVDWLLADPLNRIPKNGGVVADGWIKEEDLMVPVMRAGDGTKGKGDAGRKHWWVFSVQYLCNARGLSQWLTPDGVYGPKTEAMVRELQARSQIPVTGVVDTETLRWLLGNDAPDYA
jgi:peptidoglycan hydrolase-like protein with peptidoglycan-binding domain